MRGATAVTIQLHQIVRLSPGKTHILHPHHIWNLIYSARSNRCHDPTSPNTAPVTRKDSHASSSSHMKPHLQCTEQQVSRSNFTKYCTCHAERLACFILITYETSFTVRGATGVPIQPHQILRLSRGKTRMLHPPHIWNVIYSARSNRCPPPTSPDTAPATQNSIPKFLRKSLKTVETSFPMRGRSENVRAQSEHNPSIKPSVRNPPRKWGYFSSWPWAFSIVKYNILRPILHSNLHRILRLPRKVTLELHQVLHLPRKVTLELHLVLHLPRKVTFELHQILRLPRKVTLELHQVLHLPRKVTLELHQILRLPRKVTLELHQVLHLPRKVTLDLHQVLHLPRKVTPAVNCNFTELWLYCTLLYCTLLMELWLYSTVLFSTVLY